MLRRQPTSFGNVKKYETKFFLLIWGHFTEWFHRKRLKKQLYSHVVIFHKMWLCSLFVGLDVRVDLGLDVALGVNGWGRGSRCGCEYGSGNFPPLFGGDKT